MSESFGKDGKEGSTSEGQRNDKWSDVLETTESAEFEDTPRWLLERLEQDRKGMERALADDGNVELERALADDGNVELERALADDRNAELDRAIDNGGNEELELKLDRAIDNGGNEELELKLDRAISAGIAASRRRGPRQRRKRAALGIGIGAICMMLTLTAFVRISPAFAAIVKEVPGIGRFVELISYDQSLLTAIDHDYFQLVNRSASRNGYTFTVNGVLADSQRIVMLYTAEGPGISEENTTFLPYKLRTKDGGEFEHSTSSYHSFDDTAEQDGIVQDYLDIRIAPNEQIPNDMQVSMQLGEEWLQVEVPIDHQRFAKLEEKFELNKVIEVAGQRIHVSNVIVSPLQVTIDFKNDPANTKQVFDLIDLRLVDERGRSYTTMLGMGSWEEGIRWHFQMSGFQKAKSLTLTAKGVMLTDRDWKVVLDTDKKELLSAPDNKLSLVEMNETGDDIDLVFEMKVDELPGGGFKGYTLFEYDGSFKDASGASYPIINGDSKKENYLEIRGGKDMSGFYYYHIPKADYKQPLTLDVYEYQSYKLEEVSLKIR